MKVIYLCAPYRAPSENGVHCNIEAARTFAIEIWLRGVVCLCPHLNTAYFGGVLPDKVFLDGDIELLSRCDAMCVDDTRGTSDGMRREIAFAFHQDIPAFYGITALHNWLAKGGAKELTR